MTTDFSDSNKSQSFSRYTDADRITEITGIAKDNFPKYCYGQPLDNARDALESNYQINPIISTSLTRVMGKDNDSYDLLHLVVRNSNPGNKVAFTLDRLKSILDYERFHGSKLNVFRTSSGALGNATKDYLTMPYALINSISDDRTIHDKQWDYPLIIRHEERYKSQHNNKTAVKFPFIFEIMIVPIIGCTDTFFANQIYENGVIFIGGLNYSTTPTGTGSEYFEVHERDPYSPWMFNYKSKEADSIMELLQKCGFVPGWKTRRHDSSIDETRQKQPCVVIAHLVTPKPKYVAGYGKSNIDLRSYASTIAKQRLN
jgi:hypothetical protein